MPVNDGEHPVRFHRAGVGVAKRGVKHMIVPSVTIAERPLATCELVSGRDIALQSRRKVIRIADKSIKSVILHPREKIFRT